MIAPQLQEVDAKIAEYKYDQAAILLEPLSEQGILSGGDEVALALLLMWMPLCAWDDSLTHLRKALTTDVAFEASAWGVYICDELYPVTDEFHVRLLDFVDRAEACYLLSERAIIAGQYQVACDWIQRAVKIDPFPNALRVASRVCPNLAESRRILQQAMSGVENHSSELSAVPTNRQELRHKNWKAQIRGELITSLAWDAFYGTLFHEKQEPSEEPNGVCPISEEQKKSRN